MPSASNPALAALKDIQTPEAIGHWPLAYGYWLILVIIVTSLIIISILLIKRHKHHAAKREALTQLALLDSESPLLAIEVNALLKRSIMSYLPREQVAALDGQKWYQWLEQQVEQPIPYLIPLLCKRYQPQSLTFEEAQQLKSATAVWLQHALPLKKLKHKEEQCSH